METILGGIALTTVEKAAEKMVTATLDSLSKRVTIKDSSNLKRAYPVYTKTVMQYRSIHSPDKNLFIGTAFIPIDIKKSGFADRINIKDNNLVGHSPQSILIVGNAGSGKTTILRRLVFNNIQNKKLPIFYPLKYYCGGRIEEEISVYLGTFGISMSCDELCVLLANRNSILFLDAFDECPVEHQQSLATEINRFSRSPDTSVVCTSRPDTELSYTTGFSIYYVCDLTKEQSENIIRLASSCEEKADDLIRGISLVENIDIAEVLKTPILVTLFSISFSIGDNIPSNLTQFYSKIFDTLLFRHDNIKGRVSRKRMFSRQSEIYQNVFSAASYFSLRDEVTEFSKDKIVRYVSFALEFYAELKSRSEDLFNDIKGITNLLIEDGYDNYRYTHKSIQEYFSAYFISTSLSENVKEKFYTKCVYDRRLFSVFGAVLEFLKELDSYSYYKHYYIPRARRIFDLPEGELLVAIEIPKYLVKYHSYCMLMAKLKNIDDKWISIAVRTLPADDVINSINIIEVNATSIRNILLELMQEVLDNHIAIHPQNIIDESYNQLIDIECEKIARSILFRKLSPTHTTLLLNETIEKSCLYGLSEASIKEIISARYLDDFRYGKQLVESKDSSLAGDSKYFNF